MTTRHHFSTRFLAVAGLALMLTACSSKDGEARNDAAEQVSKTAASIHAIERVNSASDSSRNRSLWPHPDVDGWRPVFRDESDALFTRSIAWMQRMYQPRPDYRIDYQPPFVVYDLKRLSPGSGDDDSQPLDNTGPEEPATPADDPGRR